MKNWQLTEAALFPFFERTPDLVCIAGRDGFFKKVNQAVVEKLQYSAEELYARPIAHFMHPEDREATLKQRIKLLDGETLVNLENRYLTKNNDVLWLNWTSVYLPDKQLIFAIAKDITSRKKIEQDNEAGHQKFKTLTTQFKSSLEKDRKHIAWELHEQLAQVASLIKVEADALVEDRMAGQTNAMQQLERISMASGILINTIRRLSFSISPDMLEDLGLNETLDWMCKEFAMLNGVSCAFESSLEERHLSHEVKLDLFRICQEALNNIRQHAAASRVEVGLHEEGGNVVLLIGDDGKGFDEATVTKRWGLTGMHNRITSLNGHLAIDSRPGTGTLIKVVVGGQAGS
jgi:PAS domain S-box-containing protein